MPVDSFKFLPRLIAAFYQTASIEEKRPIPWTPLPKPLQACKIGLVTSAGLFCQDVDPPFAIEKEKVTPSWGDPSYRAIPAGVPQAQIGASHLHINTAGILQDANIVLPRQRFQELAAEGIVGSVAETHYSFMGYQGYPPDTSAWSEIYGPQVAAKFKAENVDCVFLTPA